MTSRFITSQDTINFYVKINALPRADSSNFDVLEPVSYEPPPGTFYKQNADEEVQEGMWVHMKQALIIDTR